MKQHLTLGDGAHGSVRLALGKTVPVSVNRDLFTEGPCEPLEAEPLLRSRIEWWQSEGVDADAIERGIACIDDVLAAMEADDLVVWAADAVSEQLHLCFVAAQRDPDLPLHHARPRFDRTFCGVGACQPARLQEVTPSLLTPAERNRTKNLWESFCAASPKTFFEQAKAEPIGSPAGHLRNLVYRLPNVESGLTFWESRLLERIARHPGEKTARTIGDVMAASDSEIPDFVGDGSLFRRLKDMAAQGLLALVGAGTSMRDTSFTLTRRGNEVLNGANRVRAVGFDRWLGGTHLAPPNMWFEDNGAAVQRAKSSTVQDDTQG